MMYLDGGYAYSSWQYTGVAIGVNALAFLIDSGTSLAGGVVASALGITINAATKFLGGYAISSVGVGTQVAKLLDKNGNGWIGFHSRNIYTGETSAGFYGFVGSEREHKTM